MLKLSKTNKQIQAKQFQPNQIKYQYDDDSDDDDYNTYGDDNNATEATSFLMKALYPKLKRRFVAKITPKMLVQKYLCSLIVHC